MGKGVADVSYTVAVTREGRHWIADVVDLPGAHTYAGNLTSLYENIYEVIALVTNATTSERPEVELTFPDGDDLIARATTIGRQRAAAEEATARAQTAATDIARSLQDAGYSVRDIAGALQMTAGRVSQILGRRAS